MNHQQIGRYQLVERLGVGGMAEVYLARARHEGECFQPCVVKLLHRELASGDRLTRMLLDEARLIARLRHNNISSLYDVGRHDDQIYMVMEYVAGRDLHSVLLEASRRGKRLSLEFAAHVASGLCNGLHFAHTRLGSDGRPLQLVHRDVSPPNVLVSTMGEIKLIDFGIAKFDSELRMKTQAGIIKGKFGYMSPEQARDEELDRRSDIFSVGVCLYEMLTGRALYGHSDDRAVMLERAKNADIQPVERWRDDIPGEFAQIVHRALRADPGERYQWAHEMQRDLRAFLAHTEPDYTALDAGKLVDEMFDIDEPALDAFAARLGDIESDGGGASDSEFEVEETEILDGAGRLSGGDGESIECDEHERKTDDFAGEKTKLIEAQTDDFAGEKTEVLESPPDDFAEEETRLLEHWHPPYRADTDMVRLDDGDRRETDADQIRPPVGQEAGPEEQTGQMQRNTSVATAESPGSDAAVAPGADSLAESSSASGNDNELEGGDDSRRACRPISADEIGGGDSSLVGSSEEMQPAVHEDGDELVDDRVQVALAVAFVLIALLFVGSRVL